MTLRIKPATSSRPPAVAGMFYPADPATLRHDVLQFLAAVGEGAAPVPKAVIAPHAGYMYSGPVAGHAYARLKPLAGRIKRVVLLGPTHRVAVRGLALPSVKCFETPFGPVAIDEDAVTRLRDLPQVVVSDQAHAAEHSLEVHLPFLQQVLGQFALVPLAVGTATEDEVAAVLARLWGGDETLIVISSDLSHYLPYETARVVDRATVDTMLELGTLDHEQACGATAVNGLLALARRRGMRTELLDLRNSGDTAGDRNRVVGYAAVALHEPAADRVATEEENVAADLGSALIAHAREAIAQRLGIERATPPRASFLEQPGATFVTLKADRNLRGCVGSLRAHRSLVEDVRANALAAAFDDPRFRPLSKLEYHGLEVEVSLLSEAIPLVVADERELHARLRPGIDGVTLQWRGRRATFLPQVWEGLPDVREFLAHLKRKAGLPHDFWSTDLAVSRYTVEKFAEAQAA